MDDLNQRFSDAEWGDMNLKTFFSILLLQRPEVKQSDIAKDLGITPATLSRIINGTYGDKKVRPDWIPKLTPYLLSIDVQRFREEWGVIEKLHDFYTSINRHEVVRKILMQRSVVSEWFYNDNWIRQNSIRYLNGKSGLWMFYDILPNAEIQKEMDEIIRRNRGFESPDIDPNRLTFLFYDQVSFETGVDYLEANYYDLLHSQIVFSAFWIDLEREILENRYLLRIND